MIQRALIAPDRDAEWAEIIGELIGMAAVIARKIPILLLMSLLIIGSAAFILLLAAVCGFLLFIAIMVVSAVADDRRESKNIEINY